MPDAHRVRIPDAQIKTQVYPGKNSGVLRYSPGNYLSTMWQVSHYTPVSSIGVTEGKSRTAN